ncbi:hypothetical protein, partial [Carboxylicivirga marina]|uniref:hypothetical protein n=1 Tax=Carboxylicivirga marina TaxID=2800988 RepID=UPI0025957B4D
MKFLFAIFIAFSACQTLYSQVYETNLIIEKAEKELQVAVGEHLFHYFILDQDSKYAYKTKSGKVKHALLTKKSQTKGDFIAVGVKFTLQHPDFNYNYVRKYVNIKLDSALNLKGIPYTDFIPEFLKKNNPCNWLSEKDIHEVLEGLNLTKSKYPLFRRLDFDVQT